MYSEESRDIEKQNECSEQMLSAMFVFQGRVGCSKDQRESKKSKTRPASAYKRRMPRGYGQGDHSGKLTTELSPPIHSFTRSYPNIPLPTKHILSLFLFRSYTSHIIQRRLVHNWRESLFPLHPGEVPPSPSHGRQPMLPRSAAPPRPAKRLREVLSTPTALKRAYSVSHSFTISINSTVLKTCLLPPVCAP